MKDLSLLVWITQLGLNVAVPLAGFILLSVWLRNAASWGEWVIWVGIILGLVSAVNGLRSSLNAMMALVREKRDVEQPVCFNDHD